MLFSHSSLADGVDEGCENKKSSNKAIYVQYTLVNEFSEVTTTDENTNTNKDMKTNTDEQMRKIQIQM